MLFRGINLILSPHSRSISIKRIGVIGAGQMGIGIAQVALSNAKISVKIYDQAAEKLNGQMEFMNKQFEKSVAKGIMTKEDVKMAISNRSIVSSLEDLSDVDMVIEAVVENEGVKRDLLKKLDKILSPHALIASNTSSISITKLASATLRPEKVIGMHFMNPVPVMKLVEVIRGAATSEDTFESTVALAQAMGKETTCSKDFPGFIANRILMPYLNEAMFTLYEGIASKEDIDTTMKLGTNVPMGPLTLADFIGLDTCLAVLNVLFYQFGDPKFRPCPLLVQYVDAGWLGKKTKKGFYEYK